MAIREKIKNWRLQRNWTCEETGDRVGIKGSHISMLETGARDFTKNTIQKYLAADPEYFEASDFFEAAQ